MKIEVVFATALMAMVACATPTETTVVEPEIPKFSCTANAATMRLPGELRASLAPRTSRDLDAQMAAVSRSVPGGFAGLFLEDGKQIMTFVEPDIAARSRQQIKAGFEAEGLSFFQFNVMTAEIRPARWSFAELEEWSRYLLPPVFRQENGVSSWDIDEKANTISIGVIDEASRTKVEERLKELKASCNLVTTHLQGYASPAS